MRRSLCLSFILLLVTSGASVADTIQSPTVQRLKERVAHGEKAAVEEFWAEAAQRGTPLIEASAKRASLVTFLWRGDERTDNVVVISPLAITDLAGSRLQRLEGTDVWYRTFAMPNDARFMYAFAVNDSLVPFDQDKNLFARMAGFRADPLNPKTTEPMPGMKRSVLELTQAPRDSASQERSGVARGKLASHTFRSKLLGNDRAMWLYTPTKRNAEPMPLLVFMDGDSYTSQIPTPTILDNLIADGTIPPVAAVFLGNAEDARATELNCSKSFSDFLAQEAVPWARERTGASGRVLVGGFSMGGLAAGCAAALYPDIFQMVLAQSGSFYRAPEGEPPEWLARNVATRKTLPVQWYLEIGLLETGPIPSRDPSMLTANRHLRDVLLARGCEVNYAERYNGHEHVAWRATLAEGLRALLGK